MSRLDVDEGVVVFTPDRDPEARSMELPRVAVWIPPLQFSSVPLVLGADAYASSDHQVKMAIGWVKTEDRSARLRGPWRVVYLGSIGEDAVVRETPIGHTTALSTEPVFIGRMEDCAICLRQGAHSDQNTVARRNTKVELVDGRVLVTDLKSTNGTRIHDREFIVGLGHHLRIDGGDGA